MKIHILSDRRLPFSSSPLAAVPLLPRSGFVQSVITIAWNAHPAHIKIVLQLAALHKSHNTVAAVIYHSRQLLALRARQLLRRHWPARQRPRPQTGYISCPPVLMPPSSPKHLLMTV
jgi:hypothetical protein